MTKPKVLLATITSEISRYYEYYDSLDRIILPPNSGKTSVHSSSPAANRNIIIRNALKHDFTHVLFLDDDHTHPADGLLRLLAHDVDIVSALYCQKFPPFPIIALNNPNEKNLSAFIDMTNIGPHELVEMPRVPAGFLLVKTSALRAMTDPWFTIGQIESTSWGDDLHFCDKAREAGLRIFIDTSVRIGHITKCILTPEWKNGEWIIRHQINSELGIQVEEAKEDV